MFAQRPFWNGGIGDEGGGGAEDKVSSSSLFHCSVACTLSIGATVSSFPVNVKANYTRAARTGQTNSISSVRRNDG